MRNLKKFLALVMAMVMAFSLMLSASAANTVKTFGDADQITEAFVEATDVLTGMKVFQGDEGGFRPADTITRAEVAALIYRLATGDVDDVRSGAYANYGNFTDVAESDWFAGYVGYCANAGYIKGKTPTTFDPYASVTGYEALAMILRAIGYDKNGEFTGATWETNVSALATQLGILTNIKTTHYGNTLYLASRRDVVAELLFQADAKVNMVNYTPAFGYQPYGDEGGVTGSEKNPTLGEKIFGLALSEKGVLLGNQQTGETGSVMGYASNSKEFDAAPVTRHVDGSTVSAVWPAGVPYSAYTWEQKYDVSTAGTIDVASATGAAATDDAANAVVGTNVKFELETGIDLIGHNLKLWYDNGNGVVSNNKKHVYAYFDKAKTAVVKADNTDLTDQGAVNVTDLCDAIGGTELKVNSDKTAVFNNSFGKFGTLDTNAKVSPDGTDADEVSLGIGNGVAVNGHTATDQFASPVKLYKVISNNKDNTVDAVIALNIESSQITESNSVNRVPTIGVPVDNKADEPGAPATGSFFVEGQRQQTTAGQYDKNLKQVGEVETGVIAKDALVGNSVSALGDYEMGIHITGTTRRDISANEATAINSNGRKNDLESSYFLLNKVTATVTGKVVAYNRAAGTVTLDNGTVLNRSKFYDTVVVKNRDVSSTVAPASAIPQGWVYDAGLANADPITDKWVEGYANETYKFYTDYEGKYLGAERSFGSTFLYGTYLDYDQKVSTSTFNYYLTGVNLNGEIETVPVNKFWAAKTTAPKLIHPSEGYANLATTNGISLDNITGTDLLGIPFRDTYGAGANQTSVNGLGEGLYTGFTVNNGTVDSIILDSNTDRNEHLANMARLGIKYAAFQANGGTTANPAFDVNSIAIDRDDVTLGARETIKASEGTASNKYFTEGTKFILVEGFGTDSVKAEVYNGISELKGSAANVFIKMKGTVELNDAWTAKAANLMTYYTESPYTYAQSGQTAMKIDTIILPKEAVSWSGGSGLYYVGNPNYSMINSWGTDAWKYDLYEDGELKQVWLTNDPSVTATAAATASKPETTQLSKDTFYNLKDTGKKANDGQPIYTAGNYSAAGVWTAGTAIPASKDPTRADGKMGIHTQFTMSPEHDGASKDGVRYSAVTRDAQTATFSTFDNVADQNATLYRVAEAKVVNLNKGAVKDAGATLLTLDKNSSGEIWPGITDLATLNEAGSINPVTGRALKVAAVVDPNNPLVITTIYVCWDQSWT